MAYGTKTVGRCGCVLMVVLGLAGCAVNGTGSEGAAMTDGDSSGRQEPSPSPVRLPTPQPSRSGAAGAAGVPGGGEAPEGLGGAGPGDGEAGGAVDWPYVSSSTCVVTIASVAEGVQSDLSAVVPESSLQRGAVQVGPTLSVGPGYGVDQVSLGIPVNAGAVWVGEGPAPDPETATVTFGAESNYPIYREAYLAAKRLYEALAGGEETVLNASAARRSTPGGRVSCERSFDATGPIDRFGCTITGLRWVSMMPVPCAAPSEP